MTPETPRGRWDDFAELWLAERPQRLWRRHSDAVNRALLATWLPPAPRRVLKTDLFDEAASTGLVPSLLARADEVVGIDVSDQIVAAAADANPRLVAMRADVRALPFPSASFDAILSNSTLDHFGSAGEVASALGELHRVLEPGGHLLVTLDNPLNPAVAIRRAIPGRAFQLVWRRVPSVAVRVLPEQISWTCGPRELERLLGDAGFDVLELGGILHAPRALAILAADAFGLDGEAAGRRFLRGLGRFESLGRLPTSLLTAHFVAARACRPAVP
jgi:SAM-dependent methyltransferase